MDYTNHPPASLDSSLRGPDLSRHEGVNFMKVRVTSSLIALSVAGIVGSVGCGSDDPGTSDNTVPVIDVALNRSYTPNLGLVTNLEEHGWPNRDSAAGAMDDAIKEARRFYDTLAAPNPTPENVDYPDPFTGAAPGPKVTAPMTFQAWKDKFNIPKRNPGESLADYRVRADVVVYYNKNELGLGRELGCAEFDDGKASDGTQLTGVACYVTNYGTAFRDVVNSLPIATEGLHAKNTVCITWRPSLPANYQVQFYTYNQDGNRREFAQLDTLGPRPLPQVCMNCHGGSYDNERHLAKYARFLPLDPNVVVFADSGPTSRAAQEESIRKLNLLSVKSPLTPDQMTMLEQVYGGKVTTPGTVSATEWAPPAWNDTEAHRQVFDKVIKPDCWTCHAAMQTGPLGDTLSIYSLFNSPALLESGLQAQVCNGFTMPNSQATLLNFWEPYPTPVKYTDGKTYASGADLLLSAINVKREDCTNLEINVDCRRSANPDALCGNNFSGRACDMESGKCVPDLKAPRQPGDPNGVCKTDKSRNCPYPEACVPATGPIPAGIKGYDGVCMP